MSIYCSHILLLIHICFPLCYHASYMCPDIILLISAIHVHTMKNHSPLTSFLTLTPIQTPLNLSRLLVLLDCSRLCYMTSRSCALPLLQTNNYLSIYVWLSLTLAKVCPHSHIIRVVFHSNSLDLSHNNTLYSIDICLMFYFI